MRPSEKSLQYQGQRWTSGECSCIGDQKGGVAHLEAMKGVMSSSSGKDTYVVIFLRSLAECSNLCRWGEGEEGEGMVARGGIEEGKDKEGESRRKRMRMGEDKEKREMCL